MSRYEKVVGILSVILVVLIFVAIWMILNIPKHVPITVTEPTVIETTSLVETVFETKETIPTEPPESIPETTEGSETTETTLPYDEDELEMLALVIYQEAGGDIHCDECRRMVADVVLNRVADERFPNTIEEVLTQPKQYGKLSWTGLVWPERALYPEEAEAVHRAYEIAEEVLLGNHSDLYGKGYIWQAEFKQGWDIIYCCGHYFGR